MLSKACNGMIKACEYVCLYVHECTCVSMCMATELNWSESVACRVVVLFTDIISIICPYYLEIRKGSHHHALHTLCWAMQVSL